ncbi:alginate export family protein [Thermaurantiacus sp.]
MATPASAELELTGAFRLRPSIVDGQVRPLTATSEAVVELRSILTARATCGAFEFLGELRDSRAYGNGLDSALLAGDVNTFEPVQARIGIDLDDVAGEHSDLQLNMGRMEMQFFSRRLLATGDFRNAAFFFTGIDATLTTKGGGEVELFWVMPQNRRPVGREAVLENRPALDRERLAVQLFGMGAMLPIGKDISAGGSLVGIVERDRPGFETRNRRLWTAGPRLLREPAPGRLDFEIEALVQQGEAAPLDRPLGPPRRVRAGMLRAVLGHSGQGPLAPRLALEFDAVSGDQPGGAYNRFDQLFGARRFEFGPSSVYGILGRANLVSPGLRFTFEQPGRAEGWIVARGLWSASGTDFFSASFVRDPTGESGRFAGVQVDARARLWLVPRHLRADLNMTGLARRGVLEDAAPGRHSLYVGTAMEAFF